MEANLRILKSIQKINDNVIDTQKALKEFKERQQYINKQVIDEADKIKEEQKESIFEQDSFKQEQERVNEETTKIIKENQEILVERQKKLDDETNELKIEQEEIKEGIKEEIKKVNIRIDDIKIKIPKDGKDGKDGRDGKNGIDGKDGKDGKNGEDGKKGKDGKDGIGILSAEVNDKGYLIITLTNGEKINVGYVRGQNGIGFNGRNGKDGISIVKVEVRDGYLYVSLSDGTEINAGYVGGTGPGEEVDPIFTSSPAYNITDIDITNWNNKSDFSGNYEDLTNKPSIPSALSELTDDNTHRVVTDTEKNTWNNKSDFSGSYNDLTDKPINVSEFNNDVGYLTGYTETDPTVPSYVKQITQNNINSWNGKAEISDIPTNVSELVNDANYATKEYVDNMFFYIPITSSNTTTVKWNELYEAYNNNLIIMAKINYVESGATIPIVVPLYSILGTETGGTIVFTFVMGTSTITYMATGTGSNVCTVIKQEDNFELISNKTQDIIANNTSTSLYPSANAVYKDFLRKPVVIWESNTPSEYLKGIQANLSASPAWQLTNLDMTPFKRIKIYSCAGQKSGTTASASTTPAMILEMSLDSRNAISAYGGNYIASTIVQKPNDDNRFATLTCAVSADKTSFVVLRQTNLYGTAATSNNDVNANVFMIEGYYY